MARCEGRLQQRRMKSEHLAAIGGGALWEQGHELSLVEPPADFGVDFPGMAAAATVQEHRVVVPGQPADERPVPHLGFRNEGGRAQGVDGEDVQP